jgi:ADP-ribosylglycohydrolase
MANKQVIPNKEPDEVDLYEAREERRRIENKAAGRSDPDQAIFTYHSSGASSSGYGDGTINLYPEYVVYHQYFRRLENWKAPSDGERGAYHHTQRFPLSEGILSKIRSTLESLRGEWNYIAMCDGSFSLVSREYDLYIMDRRMNTVLDVLKEIEGWSQRSIEIQSSANLVTPEQDDYDFTGPHDGLEPSWRNEMAVRALNDYSAEQLGISVIRTESYKYRVRGCLYGGALGDAFGYPVEFSSHRVIQKDYGAEGLRWSYTSQEPMVVSDDTQMTMFTLEGLLRGLQESADLDEEIRLAYVDWLGTQRPFGEDWSPRGQIYHDSKLWFARAPGKACISAIEAGAYGTPESPINDSKGCGGVMRVAPFAFVATWKPMQAFDAAVRAAAMTHGHPLGYLSAGALAYLLHLEVVSGYAPRTAAAATVSFLRSQEGAAPLIDLLVHAIRLAEDSVDSPVECVAELGQGWVAEEALAIGLYAALRAGSLEEALEIAANHDGDSDSTAAIAGQIFGGSRGWYGLALSMGKERLDVYDLLEGLLDQFFEIRQ